MIDDFEIFPDSANGEPAIDPDIALITAYLAGELSLMQLAALEQRLVSDAAFTMKVRPIIKGWILPVSLGSGLQERASTRTAAANLTGTRSSTSTTRKSIMRIAATITVIVIPTVMLSQLLVYVANNPGLPGHGLAHAIVPASLRAQPVVPSETIPPRNDDFFRTSDGPLQIPLTGLSPQAQPAVAVVELSAPSARTSQKFGALLGIKEVSDGKLLVNDAREKVMHLFAADLKSATVVFDSASGSARTYGGGPAETADPLISFLGDSSLFRDRTSGSEAMLVINGRGEVVRSMAAPEFAYEETHPDHKGRMIFTEEFSQIPVTVPISLVAPSLAPLRAIPPLGGSGASRRGGGGPSDPSMTTVWVDPPGDSLAILRLDLDTRQVDTLGNFALGQRRRLVTVVNYDGAGKPLSVRTRVNPLPVGDSWAVLSDGTVAIVRGRDYHVDWINPDGSRTASPKLPFDWKAVSDSVKQHLVDSTRTAMDSLDAWARRRQAGTPAPGDSITVFDSLVSTGVRPGCGGSASDKRPACPATPRRWPLEFLPLAEIADYYPPFRGRAAIPDEDGNLWILPRTTSLSKQGELIYDVVNPRRGLVQRVRIPLGKAIAGFGKGGVVYLQVGDIKSGFVLERTRLVR